MQTTQNKDDTTTHSPLHTQHSSSTSDDRDIKLDLLKAVMQDRSVYEDYAPICKDIFEHDYLGKMFVSLEGIYKQYPDITSVSVSELLKTLFSDNPTLTSARKSVYKDIALQLENIDCDYNIEIIKSIALNTYQRYCTERLAESCLHFLESSHGSFEDIQGAYDKIMQSQEYVDNPLGSESDLVTLDFDEILKQDKDHRQWVFNHPGLDEMIPGLGGGDMVIIGARPEAGKTACHVSFTFAPHGWIQQGAKVHVLCNEEPAIRTMKRGLCAYTGMGLQEILSNKNEAREKFKEVTDKVFMRDIVEISLEDIDLYCHKNRGNMDILIIDQIDHVPFKGSSNMAGHEKFGLLYARTRTLAKKYGIVVVCITQASADAQGKTRYGYECLEGSKTGKGAAADVVLTIGRQEYTGQDDGIRYFNVSKNKIGGINSSVIVTLHPQISTFGV